MARFWVWFWNITTFIAIFIYISDWVLRVPQTERQVDGIYMMVCILFSYHYERKEKNA